MDEIIQGSYYQNNYSKEQHQRFTAQFEQITQKMVAALCASESFASESMQQAVREHYEFTLQFWTPDAQTYKSLAMSYVLPTPYRDTYEGYREGLGKFIYDAVCHFADNEL